MEFLNDNKLQQESHNDGMKYVHNMNEVSQSILQTSANFQVPYLIPYCSYSIENTAKNVNFNY